MKSTQWLSVLALLLCAACSKKSGPGRPAEPAAEIISFTPSSGMPGTVVTITGKNFKPVITGNQVSFGGVAAEVSNASPTALTVKVPVGAVTGRIKVNTAVSATPFTVMKPGPHATWKSRQVKLGDAAVFQQGLGFAYNNKLYWGFTRMSVLQQEADCLVFDPVANPQEWVLYTRPPANMVPPVMQHATAAVLNGRLYLGTGLTPAASAKWWRYDPASNTAAALTDYPEPVSGALSFVLNNTLYVGFGGTAKTLHRFNEAANGSWEPVLTGNFRELTGGTAVVLGNSAYIGRALLTPGGPRQAMYRFTPPAEFVRVADLPDDAAMLAMPSFTLGGKGYFVVHKKVWEYTPDAAGGSWRVVIGTADAPDIRYVGTIGQVVFGWTAAGALYEFGWVQ